MTVCEKCSRDIDTRGFANHLANCRGGQVVAVRASWYQGWTFPRAFSLLRVFANPFGSSIFTWIGVICLYWPLIIRIAGLYLTAPIKDLVGQFMNVTAAFISFYEFFGLLEATHKNTTTLSSIFNNTHNLFGTVYTKVEEWGHGNSSFCLRNCEGKDNPDGNQTGSIKSTRFGPA